MSLKTDYSHVVKERSPVAETNPATVPHLCASSPIHQPHSFDQCHHQRYKIHYINPSRVAWVCPSARRRAKYCTVTTGWNVSETFKTVEWGNPVPIRSGQNINPFLLFILLFFPSFCVPGSSWRLRFLIPPLALQCSIR